MMYEPELDYFLGHSDWNGYTIVEHNTRRPAYDGCCIFEVCDYWISDGDGSPAKYDETYVEIEEDVRKKAMRMFREVERKLLVIGNEGSTPVEEDIKVGDYLYSRGEFFHIVSLNQGHELFQRFYCDQYDLDFAPDPFTLDDLDTTLEELVEDCFLISKETYDKAQKVARDGIAKITAYLSDQYIRHAGIQSSDL